MREIKFRAWDEVNKKMHFPVRLFCKKDGTVWHVDLGNTSRIIGQQGFKLMQFTGLFDDTGKEIYEGDIVEVTEMKTPPHRAVVHFDFRGAWIETNPLRKELGFSHIQLLYDYCDYGFGRGILSTCKVIGNIYENPELLEVSE